jgi:hypothetical protein
MKFSALSLRMKAGSEFRAYLSFTLHGKVQHAILRTRVSAFHTYIHIPKHVEHLMGK